MASVDPRQGRARAIARSLRIERVDDGRWIVPSQTGSGRYLVVSDEEQWTCTCADFELRRAACKHVFAVLFRADDAVGTESDEKPRDMPQKHRPTYPQNWPAYHRAQVEEKERVQTLLRALCDGITEPAQELGRPRMPVRDKVFCATMKVFGTMSGRRSSTDLRTCEAKGLVDEALSYNSVFHFMGRPWVRPLLQILVDESARPFAPIERQFAADATGFSTHTYMRWFDYRHGQDRREKRWIKAHAMTGTLTNVITAVHVTEGTLNDAPILPKLVQQTAANDFELREVSADKAYLSHANLAAIEDAGAVPFIPFKSNSDSEGSAAWERMHAYFTLHRDNFLAHYHRRSNVESTFSSIKRKFGAGLSSKTVTAQYNEVLLKCLCHNLSMLVHAIHEFGIAPQFWAPRRGNR